MTLAQFIIWLGIYMGVFAVYLLLRWVEIRNNQEKKARYRALPLRFKFACPLIVLPIYATSFYLGLNGYYFLQFMWVIALLIGLIIERNAVIWYRENALF